MRFRPAIKDDLDFLLAGFDETHGGLFETNRDEFRQRLLDDILIPEPKAVLLVLEKESVPAGYVLFSETYFASSGLVLWVSQAYVAPNLQGKDFVRLAAIDETSRERAGRAAVDLGHRRQKRPSVTVVEAHRRGRMDERFYLLVDESMMMNEHYKSPNHDDRKGNAPTLLILHGTGMQTAIDALKRLSDPESKVSAHYTIDEDGTVYKHVDEYRRAWHAGHSFWNGQDDLNTHSIGIELVNPGHEWGYRPYTGHQMRSLTDLCKDIMARHGIDPENVLGHSDVAPARKTDPGEYFPWHELANHGIGVWPSPSDEDAVKAAGMNIERALHDYGYDTRAKLRDTLTAFQRHFVPEAFVNGHAGEADSLTRVRLYALLAGHLLVPSA